uniref:ethanolamine kinase n=1 Tax=Globisporangium ultimum (strain ATCC 200006 / CBS 805.95 / DAOM BR144) TaxID=431595 RepID=K3WVX8_GLOUD
MAQEDVVYLNNPDVCYEYVVGGREDADEFDDVKIVVKAICPEWKNAQDGDITVKIISGGITNRLYRLIWQDYSVLVRLYGDNTEAFIDRAVENRLFALLSEQGFAPTYHGRFTNGRIEGWMEARPLEPEEMGQTSPVDFLSMIGKELGTMHAMDIAGDRSPVLWEKVERFEKLAFEIKIADPVKNAALEKLNLPELHKKFQWLKSVLPSELNGNGKMLTEGDDLDEVTKQAITFANDVVFCHNDALSGNILHNDAWDRVQIIDYEYGGYNFRGFDFANHFCENCGFEFDLNLYPGLEQQFAFFKAYMSTTVPELLQTLEANKESKAFFHALYDAVNRYALASHLFWGFWAIVQAGHSKIDFDFLEYAGKRFDAFDAQKSYFFA